MERPTDPRLEVQLQRALGVEPGSSELPDPLLNARLKARLYQAKETEKQSVRKIPLWYLPALLSILGNLVFCLTAMVLSDGFFRYMALAFAVYTSLGSVALTAAGVCFASWRETFVLVLYRRRRSL